MKKSALLLSALLTAVVLTGCKGGGTKDILNNDGALSAVKDAYKAATLSDEEVAQTARAAAAEMDSANKVATDKDKYGARLKKVVAGLDNEDGLALNFKSYLVRDVNAFAMPDGTVRVFAGLMEIMNDDELRFVIGHEIGHVKLGHSKKALQTAYAAAAARKGAAASGNNVASALAKSELGELGEAMLNAQFSQSQESDSDAYGVEFLKRHGYNLSAAITSMQKLEQLSGGSAGHSLLSSHPSSTDRVAKLKELVKAAGGDPDVKAESITNKTLKSKSKKK